MIIVISESLGHFHAALKKPGFHGHGFAVLEGDRGSVRVKSPCGGLVVTRRAQIESQSPARCFEQSPGPGGVGAR